MQVMRYGVSGMNENLIEIGKRITPNFLLPYAKRCLGLGSFILNYPKILKILLYYSSHKSDEDISKILTYLPKSGMQPFPYPWASIKEASSIKVFHDNEKKLPYVLLDEKKLYYPNDLTDNDIKNSYYFVQKIEQHTLSPHRYLTPDFNVSEDDIVVDCGVAEGNFSLAIVEQVKKIYLFEPEERWMDPLKATFTPWKNKIVIVQKYLSDISNENTITLDDYFVGKESPTFCKMDVEGYEERVLNGSKHLLESEKLKKIVTCTYHYADAEEKLGNILDSYGYTITPSSGYMLFSMYDELKPPYFRRGLLRCVKQ